MSFYSKYTDLPPTFPISGTVTALQGTTPWITTAAQSGTWNIDTVTTLTSITNPVAVTQSTSPWLTSRDWNLLNTTDSVDAVQSGTWNIATLTTITNPVTVVGTGTFLVQAQQDGTWNLNNISGTISLPTNAAKETGGNLDAILANQTNATQKTLISDALGNVNTMKTLATQVVASDYGIVTNSVIHGLTTAGGGSYVDVKVTPSGSVSTAVGDISGVVGQQNMANSLPVAIASNQSAIPVSQSGTWTVQQGTPPWQVDGNIASAATDSGNPVKVGAVFNTTLPTVTNGQRVDSQADANGRHIVTNAPLDGSKQTYSAAIQGLVAATTPTDIFTITGSASKTIRITRISFSGTQQTSAARDILLIKRSTANSGGTSTTLTNVPHDSTNAAATATVRAYTANPTLGTAVGTVRSNRIALLATNVSNPEDRVLWDFGNRPSQAMVLRGTSEVLAINLNSVTSGSSLLEIDIEWTEE